LYSITLNDPVYGALRGVWRLKAAQTGILNCRYSASLTRSSSGGSHGDLQQLRRQQVVEDKYAKVIPEDTLMEAVMTAAAVRPVAIKIDEDIKASPQSP
jgi:hypothetical protein